MLNGTSGRTTIDCGGDSLDPDGQPPRVRRTTLERFNEELSILDRPLESEIEYYDEPRPARWPRVVGAAAGLLMLAGVGFLLGGPSGEEALASAASKVADTGARAQLAPSAPVAAPTIEPVPSVALPPPPSPTEVAPPSAEGPAEGSAETAREVPSIPPPRPSVAAWAKVGRANAGGASRSPKVSAARRTAAPRLTARR